MAWPPRQSSFWEVSEQDRAPSPAAGEGSSNMNISPSATSSSRAIRGSQQPGGDAALERKQSTVSMRISSLRQAGGVNSIENFARSWQRAAGFHEITPVRRSSFTLHDDEERGDEEQAKPSKSLLGQQFEAAGGHGSFEPEAGEEPSYNHRRQEERLSEDADSHIYSSLANLTSPLSRSFGTSYGTLSSRINETSRRHAAQLFQEQQLASSEGQDKELEPLLVREVANDDGTITHVVVGQSTMPQTVFNSVNTLVGVGLLTLPLGIKYAGWLVGLLFLCFAAGATSYTAKLLSICLDIDPSLLTYADLAYVSFGSQARIVTGLLFSFELVAASVALVILFADSLDALIPGVGSVQWKLLCGLVLVPLNFAPLRLLSFSSILGILCCTLLVGIVIADGFIKPHSPGSLREPATTYLFPERWSTIPLSLGLLMSPWGAHSVFPSIYKDMRHPEKYTKSLWYTYSFTSGLDFTMAIVGLLMFGDYIQDEVTSNILLTPGYPKFLSVFIVVLIAIIPHTKVPLRY